MTSRRLLELEEGEVPDGDCVEPNQSPAETKRVKSKKRRGADGGEAEPRIARNGEKLREESTSGRHSGVKRKLSASAVAEDARKGIPADGSDEEPGEIRLDSRSCKKSRERDGGSETKLRRHEKSGHKHNAEASDKSGDRSSRKAGETSHHEHPEKSRSGHSASSSAKAGSSSKYSTSRNHDSSRARHDRLDRSPSRSSPGEHARRDCHEQSPSLLERSPHDRSHHRDSRSRHSVDRTPCYSPPRHRAQDSGHRDRVSSHSSERSPHHNARRDRSPYERSRGSQELSKKSKVSERQESSRHSDHEPSKKSSVKQSGRSKEKAAESPSNQYTELPPPPPYPPPPPPPPHSPPALPPPPPAPPQPLANGVCEELSMEEDMDICDTPPHEGTPAALEIIPGKWFYLDYSGEEQGPLKLADVKRLMNDGALLSDHMIKHADSNWWMTVENASSPLHASTIISVTVPDLNRLQADAGDHQGKAQESSSDLSESPAGEEAAAASPSMLCIDERVEALLDGCTLVEGEELEVLGEALGTYFGPVNWESCWEHEDCTELHHDETDILLDVTGSSSMVPTLLGNDYTFYGDLNDWFSSRWPCKGGDWKRNNEASQEKNCRKKIVLNESYPLCQMPKGSHLDPRVGRKDELHYTSRPMKLELPPWAFTPIEEDDDDGDDGNDPSTGTGVRQQLPSKGLQGAILPVVNINARVIRDQPSEPRGRVKSNERLPPRSSRSQSVSDRRSPHSRKHQEPESQSSHRSRTVLSIPKDRVCTVDELCVNVGDWYYMDSIGHERGPYRYSDLQDLVVRGILPEYTSVFRKVDNTWLPISRDSRRCEATQRGHKSSGAIATSLAQCGSSNVDMPSILSNFHSIHPQFIGYARGKLHELVVKSFKNRELASAINEVLDPWITSKQPKMESEFPFSYDSPEGNNYSSAKRSRFCTGESDDDLDLHEDLLKEDNLHEDLSSTSKVKEHPSQGTENETWGKLDGRVLVRIFHFLRTDMRSLLSSASTCVRWNMAVNHYRSKCRYVDFSSVGPRCTDSVFRRVMDCYKKEHVRSLILSGCSNISAAAVEELLHNFLQITVIDIQGCNQFKDLRSKYDNVKWISLLTDGKNYEVYYKARTPKQIGDNNYGDSASLPFRQGFYNRSKLLDARKAALMSRDVEMRQWMQRKTDTGFRRIENFVVSGLRAIMRENKYDFFIPRVAKIENKMRCGFYARRGLSFMKEDISSMCSDALKYKGRGDRGNMKQVILSFIDLARKLENPGSIRDDDRYLSTLNVSSDMSKYQAESNTRRKQSEKKETKRSTSDREIRRSLSKLKKKEFASDSETSDDRDDSEGEGNETVTTASDNESGIEETSVWDMKVESLKADEFADSVDYREWGARMTNAGLVPPVTRKYEVIDSYHIVVDEEEVLRKMRVALPDECSEKMLTNSENLDVPEVMDYKPRKMLGDEVLEQEVYGIDPYTHNLLLDSMPEDADWTLAEKHEFIEKLLLNTLNKQVRHFTGARSAPMQYNLQPVVEEVQKVAEEKGERRIVKMCSAVLKAIKNRPEDNYVAYRKGLGVVCNKAGGFGAQDFVVEFLGEVYPAWRWYEKQDGIKSLQKNKEEAPEFYNIMLERAKGDLDGYDLVIVDAMHKANYASRICHSCNPNCEAKVTAVGGQYQIGIYTVQPIAYGEEITFDYNSVTESKQEYEASVCLCGSRVCRGSYLSLSGEGAFDKILIDYHGVLDRHSLMLEACVQNSISHQDIFELRRVGLGACLLDGLPDWLVAYAARLVRFISFERTKLPGEILKRNLDERRKYCSEINMEVEKNDSEIQAEGVMNTRLQNLAHTLDKVRYVMRRAYGDPRNAPPPIEKLSAESLVHVLWKGEGSLVDELIRAMSSHVDPDVLSNLKAKIRAHDPSGSEYIRRELRRSLIWLRDELRTLPCTFKCRHDAAADLIHMYAYTRSFFKIREYKTVKSSPVLITPMDLGSKDAETMKAGNQEYSKTYGSSYCLGQLIYWYSQNPDPEAKLIRATKGCMSLPDVSSFYARSSQKQLQERVYGSRTVRFMLSRMENQTQRPWPKDRIWAFKSNPTVFGSPMLDSVMNNSALDKEMIQWLRSRPNIFLG